MTGIDADRKFVGVVGHLRRATVDMLQSGSSSRPGPIWNQRRRSAATEEGIIVQQAHAKMLIRQALWSQFVKPELYNR